MIEIPQVPQLDISSSEENFSQEVIEVREELVSNINTPDSPIKSQS